MPELINGFGTRHHGKDAYIEYEKLEEEEFDTTVWFCLFWVPIIPLKSYRIRQKLWYHRKELRLAAPMGIQANYTFQIVKNYDKFKFRQIWVVYLTMLLCIFGLILLNYLISKITHV